LVFSKEKNLILTDCFFSVGLFVCVCFFVSTAAAAPPAFLFRLQYVCMYVRMYEKKNEKRNMMMMMMKDEEKKKKLRAALLL